MGEYTQPEGSRLRGIRSYPYADFRYFLRAGTRTGKLEGICLTTNRTNCIIPMPSIRGNCNKTIPCKGSRNYRNGTGPGAYGRCVRLVVQLEGVDIAVVGSGGVHREVDFGIELIREVDRFGSGGSFDFLPVLPCRTQST